MTNTIQLRDEYIALLRDIIINTIYSDNALKSQKKWKFWRSETRTFDLNKRLNGSDWPSVAHSMIGLKRMNNVRDLLSKVIENKVPGDFIETGVWRGGACIFARGICRAYGENNRTIWVADSFEGLPKPNEKKYKADVKDKHYKIDLLAVTLDQVKANFKCYGLLDEQVKFLKGWFKETLPTAPIEKLAILRLDGDMYESTMDALVSLYPKVSPGGYVIVDDYHDIQGCKLAINDYMTNHAAGETLNIQEIDGHGIYWQRNI
jgi:O-methyltransferase